MKIKKADILVQVAKMYYLYDLNQNAIASKLNVSRSYVSKLLTEAKEKGIVKIEIVEPVLVENAEETSLREYFGLYHVIVVPKSTDKAHAVQIGDVAGKYIGGIISNGDTIGFSWGETMYRTVQSMPDRTGLEGIKTIQLCGGISNIKRNIYVAEIAQEVSRKYGSTGYILPFPAIVGTTQLKKQLDNEPAVKEIMTRIDNANVLVMTVGAWGKQSSVARAGYLSKDEIEVLTDKGAVCDLCTHILDIDGQIVDRDLDSRTVAVPLKKMKRAPYRVLVAAGASKIEGIVAALNTGVPNVFITNEETVEMMHASFPDIFSSQK